MNVKTKGLREGTGSGSSEMESATHPTIVQFYYYIKYTKLEWRRGFKTRKGPCP